MLPSFQLELSNSVPVTSGFTETSGTVTFSPSTATANLLVTVLPDTLPEVAQFYVVRLINVTGGARLASTSDPSNTLTAQLIIADSDNAYGVLEFGPNVQQTVQAVRKEEQFTV